MFEYTVCTQANESLFYQQCKSIEDNVPGLTASELLDDVDGTLVQRYSHQRGCVVVKNDCQVDALYVQSDFDLLPYFK